MSQLIEDVLNVLREMRSHYAGEKRLDQISSLRGIAVRQVAGRRNIGISTIEDGLRRRLALVSVPDDFDPLAVSWLKNGNPDGLRAVLDRAAKDDTDKHLIRTFFKPSSDRPNIAAIDQTPKPARNSNTHGGTAVQKPIAIILDPDVAKVFSTDKKVNDVLRALIRISDKVNKH